MLLTQVNVFASAPVTEATLDKAFDAFRWFDRLGDESAKKRIPPQSYREKISPLELLQCLAVFKAQNTKEQTDTAMLLVPMLPHFKITPEEAYGLLDQLDEKSWNAITELDEKLTAKIKEDADRFRKEMLNASEKFILLREPETAADIFKAVAVIAVTGKPVLVRHYLKQFLDNENSENKELHAAPAEAAAIVKTVGSNDLMRLAVNPDFAPFGRNAVVRLIETASRSEGWQAVKSLQSLADNDAAETAAPTVLPPRESPDAQSLDVLAKTTVAKDRRLRFTALQSVMNLKPSEPYAGSSLVAETLLWFAKSNGERVIVTVHPKISIAGRIGSYFMHLGYKHTIASTCRDALKAAADSPDIELLVIDEMTGQPPIADFFAAMQNDCRTAEIPVAVLTSDKDKLKRKIEQLKLNNDAAEDNVSLSLPGYPLVRMYPWLTNEQAARWVCGDVVTKTRYEPVPPKERLEQARQALLWLKEIVEAQQQGSKIYHFDDLESAVLDAVHSNARLPEGLDLAASLKSELMQKTIYDIAANAANAMPVRSTAAAAFERSVETHGVLLRGKNVQALYDRYSASGHEPKESQELLRRIIGVVENKTSAKSEN
jgi:CheY-like chemotaxis protein